MTQGISIEHFIYYFVEKPLLVITASRRLLYGETSRLHCSGVILAHSSTQWSLILKVPWASFMNFDLQFSP